MGFYVFKLKYRFRQLIPIGKCVLMFAAFAFGINLMIEWNNHPMAIETPFIYIEPMKSYFRFKHSNLTKDWHDYEMMKQEALRAGPGEQGEPVYLSPEEKEKNQKYIENFNHFGLVSEKIARDRALPDTRPQKCRDRRYLADLPSVSVVIPLHDEVLSVVVRTIHSLFNRSPPELLKEIILVNDKSDMEDNFEPLEEYARTNFDMNKLQILRMPVRSGLMWARLAGARAATGDVLVFMDCHSEVNANWLPPLIEPIAQNYRVCALPVVDAIDRETYWYHSDGEDMRGGFDWTLWFRFLPLRPEQKQLGEDQNYQNPLMVGCVFAMSAKFFWELGGYDPGLAIWGGENLEMSFKVWLCNGEQLNVPCSRIGHLYRQRPTETVQNRGDYEIRNYKRVAEMWMDEYKHYVYDRLPDRYSKVNVGDLSYMIGVKEKLKCKPFKYYLEVVAPEILDHYPKEEPPVFASGGIQSVASPNLCVDTLGVPYWKPIGLYECQEPLDNPKFRQNFKLRNHRNIFVTGTDSDCFHSFNGQIMYYICRFKQEAQYFRYDLDTKQIFCGRKRDQMCMDMDAEKKTIFVEKCDENKITQKWNWGFVNETMLRNWADYGKPIKDPLELEDFKKN